MTWWKLLTCKNKTTEKRRFWEYVIFFCFHFNLLFTGLVVTYLITWTTVDALWTRFTILPILVTWFTAVRYPIKSTKLSSKTKWLTFSYVPSFIHIIIMSYNSIKNMSAEYLSELWQSLSTDIIITSLQRFITSND